MSNEAQQSHAQQFEHAIATAFTCRSIIKYNSSLSEEQKNELIADLDTTLQFLCERLVANASIEAKMVLPPLQLAGLISSGNVKDDDDNDNEGNPSNDEHTLRGLYKIYRTYLSMKQGKGTDAFIARYNEVMSTLDEVQKIVEKSNGVYPSHVYVEDLLHRVRGFITDLYVIFTEFAFAITIVLQGNDFSVDTEEISSLQKHGLEGTNMQSIPDLAALRKMYETHLHLNERKGAIASRVGDATAFLIFLEENLDFDKRDEITAQLNSVAKLLGDLAYLLSDYEHTVSTFLSK
jgi:hypothetical protein